MNDNLKTVTQVYEAFGKGDIPAILNCISDNVQWEQWADNYAQRSGVPWLTAQHGKEGALSFFKTIGEFTFTDFQVLSIMNGGNQVAAEVQISIEIPSTGQQLSDEELHLWTFDEQGKVIRFRHYVDTAKHIAAANPK